MIYSQAFISHCPRTYPSDMASPRLPLGCYNPGEYRSPPCCYPDNLTQAECRAFIGPDQGNTILDLAFPGANYLAECQNVTKIYGEIINTPDQNNYHSIQRYMACVAVPALASYEANGFLPPSQSALVQQSIPRENATQDTLRNITAAVTECLTHTCQAARNKTFCYSQSCAPTHLLINSTMPNQMAINECLLALCKGGFDALPYADSDIIGIGVSSSMPSSR